MPAGQKPVTEACIRDDPDCACDPGELAAFTGLYQSACSQHLARLRDAGVIAPRRDAQTIYYRIEDPAAVRLIALLCDIYRDKAAGTDGLISLYASGFAGTDLTISGI